MGNILHLLEADQRVIDREPGAKTVREHALAEFDRQFGHLGERVMPAENAALLGGRTEDLKADAIGGAAREAADRLTMTLARGYAHHAAADDLLAALERDSQRMAARCTTVRFTGFQATADAYLRALLRGQVLRLMGGAHWRPGRPGRRGGLRGCRVLVPRRRHRARPDHALARADL